MKKLLVIFTLYLCFINELYASSSQDIEEIVSMAKAQESKAIKPYLAEAQADRRKGQTLIKEYQNNIYKITEEQNTTSVLKTERPNQSAIKTSKVLVFVSFSMPDELIKSYIKEANKIQAPVVIRGLIDNSFKKTFQKINTLVKDSGGGVELNPLMYDQYNIKQVPAIVVLPELSSCKNEKECDSEKEFDVIEGNISLIAALREIKLRGNIGSKTAEEQLNILKEKPNVF